MVFCFFVSCCRGHDCSRAKNNEPEEALVVPFANLSDHSATQQVEPLSGCDNEATIPCYAQFSQGNSTAAVDVSYEEEEEEGSIGNNVMSVKNRTLVQLFKQLHDKGVTAHRVKQTRHKSLYGHRLVIECFQFALGMSLISHEERFFIPEEYVPDLIFNWERAENYKVTVFCEVKQHPPHDRNAQTRKNYRNQRNAKIRKLKDQCERGYRLLGHDLCCFVGLFLENSQLRVILCLGDSSQVLLNQLNVHGQRYGIRS